jgi:hypothetical protein
MRRLTICAGMYMTGNSLQIFSIMMVFMLFKAPITALIGIQQTFARFETDGTRDKMLLVKLVYLLCNGLALALGIWKVNQMGLLPCVYPHQDLATGTLIRQRQDDTIRLACLGDGARTTGKGIPCIFDVIDTLIIDYKIETSNASAIASEDSHPLYVIV